MAVDVSAAITAPAVQGMPDDWEDWLAARGTDAGFHQTSAWAAISAALNDAKSYVLTVEEGGRRIGGMLVSFRPAKYRSWAHRGRTWLMGRGRGLLECIGGPLLGGADPAATLADLLEQFDRLARRLGVGYLRFTTVPPADWVTNPAIAEVFARFNYRLEPWLTSIVDLSPSESDLHRAIRQSARKGIRRCREAGLSVVPCRTLDDYLRDFCTPYHDAVAADGHWRPEAAREAQRWLIDGGRHYRFFVVKDGGGAVHATLGTMSYNGMATEILSARTPAGRQANLPAQDLLHWEVMLAHRKAGDRYFNLAGYRATPRDDKEAGIRRFKEKWGGREVAFPEFIRGDRPFLVRAVLEGLRRRAEKRGASA
jgi:hypothetical protein